MPTSEQRVGDNIITTTWEAPLRSSDLSQCFANLRSLVSESNQPTHILFDIADSGNIPAQAPMLFIRAKLTEEPNLGNMAVIGTSALAQILAQTAIKLTGQNILFFPSEQEAVEYLRDS